LSHLAEPQYAEGTNSTTSELFAAISSGPGVLFRVRRDTDGPASVWFLGGDAVRADGDMVPRHLVIDPDALWSALAPGEPERARSELERAEQTGDDAQLDVSVVDLDGRSRRFHAVARLEHRSDDGSVTWRGIITDITREHRERELSRAQQSLLERIATGSPLPVVLDDVCRLVEQRIPESRSSILRLAPLTRRVTFGAAPSLPMAYMRALESMEVGPEAGSCGTAMYYGTPVISPDVPNDPKWSAYLTLAEEYDIGACWSIPFSGPDGRVAGSLSAYFDHPRHPRPNELDTLKTCAHLAGIASQRSATLEALDATEDQLRHAQKMEAVGQLAGGVAHDFNNILTVIQGSATLLSETLPENSEERGDAELIVQAARRAEALTRQLLVFGRRQNWEPTAVSINEVIRRIDGILRRLMGERVDVRLALDASIPAVWIDEAQLEQVLINVAVNARDAMPDGGRFELATSPYVVEDETADLGAPAGAHFVRIEAKDTGRGMDSATLSRIFEPFFSTKPRETSSGLGLSVAYGIVERAGGTIAATSTPGAGSHFRIDLPVAPDEPTTELGSRAAGGLAYASDAQHRSVLLVEDEPMVRMLAARTLRSRGYEVIEAEDGQAGLRALEARDGEVDIVVSDVVMPRMTGSELMEIIRERWSEVPVLLMTGYADDIALLRDPVAGRLPLLTKPFTPSQLAREVGRALDE